MSGMSRIEIDEQLAGIVSAMRADSYEVDVVGVQPDGLSLRITALDGACEDCLSPHAVMAGVVSGALGGRYTPEQIRIAYPAGTNAH